MPKLLLNRLWTGVQQQVTIYEDNPRADLVVVPPCTGSRFADTGAAVAWNRNADRRVETATSVIPAAGSKPCW